MNIEASKCRLRALEIEDLEVMYGWENNMDLWRVSGTVAPFSRHMLSRLIEEQQYDIYATRQLRLVVEVTSSDGNVAVGAVDLFDFDPQHARAGVGVLIAEEYRSRGLAKDALMAVERYAREVLGLHQLWCHVGATNEASRALFAACGFKEGGLKRDWIWSPEGWQDEIMLQKML